MMKVIPAFFCYTLGLVLSIATLVSCKKSSGTDDAKAEASNFGNISYFAKAGGPGSKTAGTKSTATLNTVAVDWSSASVYVEKIVFVGKNKQVLDTTIWVSKKLDIFNAAAMVGVIKLPVGSYKDVMVKMFCRKSDKSEMAFDFRGTFTNSKGGKDSIMVGSSYPFEAELAVTNIDINPYDHYKATFSFDLTQVLTGISTSMLENMRGPRPGDQPQRYVIWKGGSADEPFYDEVIRNWQSVASIVVTKEDAMPQF